MLLHSGGVGLFAGNSVVRGCLGNKGVGRSLGGSPQGVDSRVMETMGGKGDEGATGGDGCGVVLGNGGMSHGRGMRSSEDGPVIFLIGGSGISSGVGDLFHGAGITGVASLCGGDGVSDKGNGISTGSGVSSIGDAGSLIGMGGGS